MTRHADVHEIATWCRFADTAEAQARSAASDGLFDAACHQARHAARHLLTGMMRGIWTWVSRYEHDVWGPALDIAFNAAGAAEARGAIGRSLAERCPREIAGELHDSDDSARALADLEAVRAFVDAVWRSFTDELDATEATGALPRTK